MALTQEDLIAISDLLDSRLDTKLEPIKADITSIKLDIENEIKPNIQLLAENYVPAAKKYVEAAEQIEGIKNDVEVLKKVVTGHSEKLQQLA